MENIKYVDLHIHTNYSDGTFTPEEAVQNAKKVGLTAIAITDHDCVAGIDAAMAEGERIGVEVISGVELSTEIDCPERSEMHILGYLLNWKNAQLQESLSLFQKSRQKRANQINDKLSKMGLLLGKEKLDELSKIHCVGRLHFAKALLEAGYVATLNEAFQKYLSFGKPAYVPKFHLKPEEAISLILKTGGIPVLAHPYYGHYSNKNMLNSLVRSGLAGIEVWHSRHGESTVNNFLKLTKELNLLATGGSDCHGVFGGEPAAMGRIKIPYSVVENLKKHKEQIDKQNSDILTSA
jgi:hypothetical protein